MINHSEKFSDSANTLLEISKSISNISNKDNLAQNDKDKLESLLKRMQQVSYEVFINGGKVLSS